MDLLKHYHLCIMVLILSTPIDVSRIISEITTPESGGIDVFIGTVRNHSDGRKVRQLEYSAYTRMAESLMGEIEQEMRQRWPVHGVALVHRVGMLAVGDVAVVTGVSATHRVQAFEACRYAIDRIKAVVPIWKKEYYDDGPAWGTRRLDEETVRT